MSKNTISLKDYYRFVNQVQSHIDNELFQKAKTIEFGQWELPFEAILLALVKQSNEVDNLDFELIIALAEEADILYSGVLDIDTWKKFTSAFGLQ